MSTFYIKFSIEIYERKIKINVFIDSAFNRIQNAAIKITTTGRR